MKTLFKTMFLATAVILTAGCGNFGSKNVNYFELSKSCTNKNAIYANLHKWQYVFGLITLY